MLKIILLFALTLPLAGQGIVQILGKKPAAGGGGADVSLDVANTNQDAPSTSLTAVTGSMTTGTNRAILLVVGLIDSGTSAVTGVSGAGATWTQVGSVHTGNSTIRGSCWVGIAPTSTGAVNLTVTTSSTQSLGAQLSTAHIHNANQTAANYSCSGVNSGSLNASVASGGYAFGVHYDSVDNRTVSGCTTTLLNTNYVNSFGWSAAGCTTSPTSTFTWSGFGGISFAMAMVAPKQ